MAAQDKKRVLNDINLSIKYIEKQQPQKALSIFNSYSKNLPNDPDILVQYAELSRLLGHTDQALYYLYKVGEICPNDTRVPGNLGNVLLDQKKYHDANVQLRKAIDISPDSWQILLHLGIANSALGNYDDAIAFLEKAQALKPGASEIYENLAACMFMTDRNKEVQEYARKATRLNPNNYNAHNLLGLSLSKTGEMAEAIKCLEKAIKIDRLNPSAYVNLTTIKSFSSGDKRMINRMGKILEKSMPAKNRCRFCFALGKMYDDCEEWDKAFFYINQANLLARPVHEENSAPKHHLKSLKKTYSRQFFEKYKHLGNQSEIPVFIVGMPRSGTALIEQIIATHPDATAAGELEKMEIVAEMIATTDKPGKYRAAMDEILNKNSINEQSNTYLEDLCKNRKNTLRITDKTTNNYLYLGLIALLFPNCKIIHVTRSPLDTCISCYFQYFTNRNFGWSFDPRWITNTYHSYRQTMNFWRSVLPENMMLDINYEGLISEPERCIRSILAFCGLAWHPACMDFYKTRNIVKTTSQIQVSQPLYNDSVQRWKRYGMNVEEFAKGLEKYLDDSEKQQLQQLGIKLDSGKWWNVFA